MSSAMEADFSHAKHPASSENLWAGKSLWCGAVHVRAGLVNPLLMAALPETSEEIEARRMLQLAEQKTMLEHLPNWVRNRGLKQRHVAEALGVSEGTVSNWIAGRQQMSVGQLRQIAVLLKADPGDLLRAPTDQQLGPKVEETLELMDKLSDQEWHAVLTTARTIAAAKSRS